MKKQAVEASKYKIISEQIKKIEAGLYYIKLTEIEKEITSTSGTSGESDKKINSLIMFGKNNMLNPAAGPQDVKGNAAYFLDVADYTY